MPATQEPILESTQTQRLEAVLKGYFDQAPIYSGAGRSTSAPLLERHQQLPFLSKIDIRRGFPGNFIGPDADLDALIESGAVELEHTSGTSDQRTPLLLPKGWWAEQERLALALNPTAAASGALLPSTRRVAITSPSCNNDISYSGTPSCADRVVGSTQFVALSKYPFLWSESDLARMAEETVDWNPVFLDVDPVYGAVFALYCERHGIRIPSLRFILSSYEYLSVNHRRIMQRVFQVPVFNLYGSTETGHLMMEDDSGSMRPSLETAVLDIAFLDERGIGDIIVSTLTNPYMPLLRYRIGDLACIETGPGGPRYELHGRAADAFHTPSGKRVTVRDVDQCFAGLGGVVHYQLAAKEGRFQLRTIPDGHGLEPTAETQLRDRLEHQLEAPGAVQIEPTDLMVPQGSGKFRLCIPAKPATQAST